MRRWIIRPQSIITTPRLIAEALNARRTVRYPSSVDRVFDWDRDFFLVYPDIQYVRFTEDAEQQMGGYRSIRSFCSGSKAAQRSSLRRMGCPTPETWTTRDEATRELGSTLNKADYIVRPLRHSKGLHYRRTSDLTDFEEGKEYLQRVFPKKHEYRIVYCMGKVLATLYKRVPEDIDPNGPWNHEHGSTFVTVNDENNNRLRHTNVYEVLSGVPIIKCAHLVGADILLGSKKSGYPYVITELNFCPALTIDTNLERLRSRVNQVLG